jgi:hypothetical protein
MDLKQELQKKVAILQEEMKALYVKERRKLTAKLKQSFINEVVENARKKAEEVADKELSIQQQRAALEGPTGPLGEPVGNLAPPQGWSIDEPKNDGPAIVAMASSSKKGKKRKETRPRAKKGTYTEAETFSPMVIGLLIQHGPMKKNQIAEELTKQNGVLNSVDLEKHPDGVPRFYKTLDRTRKLLLKNNHIVINTKGTWELSPVQQASASRVFPNGTRTIKQSTAAS